MKAQDANIKRSTDAPVEHITVPNGDGFVRWHTINRGGDASGHGAGHDTDNGGADPAGKGELQHVIDLAKSKLMFWR